MTEKERTDTGAKITGKDTARGKSLLLKSLRNYLVANVCALLPMLWVGVGWMPDQVKVFWRGEDEAPVAIMYDGLVLQGEDYGRWTEGRVWRYYLREGMDWQDLAFRLPEEKGAENVGRIELQKWKLLRCGKAGSGLVQGEDGWKFENPRFEWVGFASRKTMVGMCFLELLLVVVSWLFARRCRGEHCKVLLPSVICVALALAALTQVALPVQSYLANQSSYPFSGGELAMAVAVRFAWVWILTTVALLLLARCFGRFVLGIAFAFAVCMELESSVLAAGLPNLNGDWSFFQNKSRAIWDATVWCAVFALVLGLYPFLKRWLGWIAVGWLVMLASASVFDVEREKQADTSKLIVHNFSACEDVVQNIAYSSKRNVMVFVVDSIEREQAHAIMFDPEVGPRLREKFRGFTEYADNVGALPFSMAAVANLFTGKYPGKTTSMVDYFWSCYSPESALADFLETDHAVYMATTSLECGYLSDPIKDNRQETRHILPLYAKGGGAWNLTDLTRWRWMPFAVKAPYAYLMEIQGTADGDFREWRVYPILAKGEVVNEKSGVFSFIHTSGVHVPAICDRNGTMLTEPEDDEHSSFEQGIYVLNLLGDLMDSYREKGIYDNSLIVVLGDHGRHQWGGYTLETNMLPFNGRPCLWMKPMGRRADFGSSSIPSSHAKVAEVLKQAAHHDLSEEEIQRILATDERIYHRIEWWGGEWNEWIVGKDGTTVFRSGTESDFGEGAKPLKCGSRYSFKIVDFAQNGADVYFSNVVNQGGLPVFQPDSGEMGISFRVPDVARTYRAKLWTGDVGGGILEVSQGAGGEWTELPVALQTALPIHHVVAATNGMATLRFRWKEGEVATATKFESFVLEMEP